MTRYYYPPNSSMASHREGGKTFVGQILLSFILSESKIAVERTNLLPQVRQRP